MKKLMPIVVLLSLSFANLLSFVNCSSDFSNSPASNDRISERSLVRGLSVAAFTQGFLSVNAKVGTTYLANYFLTYAQVFNSQWAPLPKTWNELLAGPKQGGAGITTAGAPYGGNSVASAEALYVVPPESSSDFVKMTFPVQFQQGLTWYFNFKLGYLNAMADGGPVSVRVVVGGDTDYPAELPWKVLGTVVLRAGDTKAISFPLGLWPLRRNFNIALQVQKNSSTTSQPLVVIDNLNISSSVALPESGIARSNLIWASASERANVINGSAGLGARWFRDGFRAGDEAAFVDIVSRVKAAGMKMLVTIMQDPSDYSSSSPYVYGGAAFHTLCGWSSGALPLSTIDYSKFRSRLRSHLQALKAAGLTVDAFEIGNEIDWVCFNGDIPFGQVASDEQKIVIARAYAWFLAESAKVIRDPSFYPRAKLITAGMANIQNYATGYHLDDPAAVLALIRNLDGVNYFDNVYYRVDGIGVHLYPDPNDPALSGLQMLQQNDRSLRPLAKPYWITEWGLRTDAYSSGTARAQAMLGFLEMLASQYGKMQYGPEFFYAYDSPYEKTGAGQQAHSLSDNTGALLLEAGVFQRRYRW